MSTTKEFIRKSLSTLWEGILKHTGLIVAAFLFSGGYLAIINLFGTARAWINQIPTLWIFTPLILLLVFTTVVLRIVFTQRLKLIRLEKTSLSDADATFVTHHGVWWRIYRNSDYIEDFPYCSCCEPRFKLVQIEWYPDEVYKCSKSGTQYKLFDGVPRKREEILQSLYESYFEDKGMLLLRFLDEQAVRIKELHPDYSDEQLLNCMFTMSPLKRIPENDRKEMRFRYSKPSELFWFLQRNFKQYREYLEAPNQEATSSKST